MQDDRIIGNMGEYTVKIIKNDKGAPHMHIVNDKCDFDCAIELLHSQYMPDTKNILDNKELECFNNWVSQSQTYGHLKIQNWEKALFYWQTITDNCDIELSENRVIPNYNKLRSDMYECLLS